MPNTREPGWIPGAPKTFGERLKRVRTELGLSQIEFAESIGVPHQTLSTWERGATPSRDINQFEVVNRVYAQHGTNRDWLAYGETPS